MIILTDCYYPVVSDLFETDVLVVIATITTFFRSSRRPKKDPQVGITPKNLPHASKSEDEHIPRSGEKRPQSK